MRLCLALVLFSIFCLVACLLPVKPQYNSFQDSSSFPTRIEFFKYEGSFTLLHPVWFFFFFFLVLETICLTPSGTTTEPYARKRTCRRIRISIYWNVFSKPGIETRERDPKKTRGNKGTKERKTKTSIAFRKPKKKKASRNQSQRRHEKQYVKGCDISPEGEERGRGERNGMRSPSWRRKRPWIKDNKGETILCDSKKEKQEVISSA